MIMIAFLYTHTFDMWSLFSLKHYSHHNDLKFCKTIYVRIGQDIHDPFMCVLTCAIYIGLCCKGVLTFLACGDFFSSPEPKAPR